MQVGEAYGEYVIWMCLTPLGHPALWGTGLVQTFVLGIRRESRTGLSRRVDVVFTLLLAGKEPNRAEGKEREEKTM